MHKLLMTITSTSFHYVNKTTLYCDSTFMFITDTLTSNHSKEKILDEKEHLLKCDLQYITNVGVSFKTTPF